MTQLEKQEQQVQFFIKYKGAVEEKADNVRILRYDLSIRGNLKPACAVFVGKSAKPSANYYYSTEDRREETIQGIIERERSNLEEKKRKSEERKAFVPKSMPGDIFVSSWGYDQTQVDFYLLQSVNKKTGTFVRIGSSTVEGSEGHDCCQVVAAPEVIIGEPFKKLIQNSGNSEHISLRSYEYCSKWSGRPMYRSWGY